MRVLVACEFSGIVRDAFAALGHDAWSCDLLPSERPGQHLAGDISVVLGFGWDVMIAHPPCVRLCNSGVRWLAERNLWDDLDSACGFFEGLLRAPIPRICIENPIPHKYARRRIGRYTQLIQPWQFGHPETKATCLWLKGLAPLVSTSVVSGRRGRVWLESPGPERSKTRSRTYSGIAAAMAAQWGPKL